MADSDELSLKDRKNEPELILQDLPQAIPSFVHVLPCTNPPVIYLERLDGCATGIHLTRKDTQSLHELYSKMGNAILAKDKSLDGATLDGCSLSVCKTRTMLGPMSLVHYMENCAHYFHYGCLVGLEVASRGCSQLVDCPCCKVPSTRALLWPNVFPDIATKNEIFQLQKRTFGIDVAPRTLLKLNKYYVDENLYPAFDLFVKEKQVTVRKRPAEGSSPSRERQSDYSMKQPTGGHCPEQAIIKVTEVYLVQIIQRICLANQPNTFYLGDILPIEENGAFQAEYGLMPPLDDFTRRQKLLLQFKCPFPRVSFQNGERCSQGRDCEFWHGWQRQTPAFIVEQVKIRM